MNRSSFRPAADAEHPAESTAAEPPCWERARSLRLAGCAAEAVQALRSGPPHDREDYRLHDELGTALLDLERYEEAIGPFLTALRLNPDFDEVCPKIGYAFAVLGLPIPAIEWFERGRAKNPDPTRYLGAYGRALISAGRYQLAAEVFDQWTKVEPESPIAQHVAAAALGDRDLPRPSVDYVRSLFNDCATRFEATLARLKYCGPKLIADALQQVAPPPADGWDVLDVGCGTGLVGVRMRPLARRLVGVDVSAGMLDLARQRNVYDELIEAELIEFLRDQTPTFDVLTASDVLTYVGELGEFFLYAKQVLRPRGIVVVAVEALGEVGSYRLTSTGRYRHSDSYLRTMMESSGLTLVRIREDVMRHERGRPVPTLVATAANLLS